MRLTAPAACRSRFAYIHHILSREVRAFSPFLSDLQKLPSSRLSSKTVNPKKNYFLERREGRCIFLHFHKNVAPRNEKNLKQIFLVNIESIHLSTVGMIDQVNLVRRFLPRIRLNPFSASKRIDRPFISLMDRWWNLAIVENRSLSASDSLPRYIYETLIDYDNTDHLPGASILVFSGFRYYYIIAYLVSFPLSLVLQVQLVTIFSPTKLFSDIYLARYCIRYFSKNLSVYKILI